MASGWGNIFDVQRHPYAEEVAYAQNNLAADPYVSRLAAEQPAVFMQRFPQLAALTEHTADLAGRIIPSQHPLSEAYWQFMALDPPALEQEATTRSVRTVSQLRLFTTNNCEATCPSHCYTKQLLGPYEPDRSALTAEQRQELIRAAKGLGAKLLYIAGRGEPLLDPGVFNLLRFAREEGLDTLIFTNGIILSNDAHAQRFWGKSSAELVRELVELDVHIYHKLWSTDPNTQEAMMHVRSGVPTYEWVKYTFGEREVYIPRGLSLHLQLGDRGKVGIEAVVDRNTVTEIKETIIPFIEATGIRSYVEPFITSGRGAKHPELVASLSDTHAPPISEYLVREGCRLTAYILTVLEEGTMSFCLSVESELIRKQVSDGNSLNVVASDGSLKDLFALNHAHPFIVQNRYQGFLGGCRCQTFNEELYSIEKSAPGRSLP